MLVIRPRVFRCMVRINVAWRTMETHNYVWRRVKSSSAQNAILSHHHALQDRTTWLISCTCESCIKTSQMFFQSLRVANRGTSRKNCGRKRSCAMFLKTSKRFRVVDGDDGLVQWDELSNLIVSHLCGGTTLCSLVLTELCTHTTITITITAITRMHSSNSNHCWYPHAFKTNVLSSLRKDFKESVGSNPMFGQQHASRKSTSERGPSLLMEKPATVRCRRPLTLVRALRHFRTSHWCLTTQQHRSGQSHSS